MVRGPLVGASTSMAAEGRELKIGSEGPEFVLMLMDWTFSHFLGICLTIFFTASRTLSVMCLAD